MKTAAQSMTPDEAAAAFFGQNEQQFAAMIEKLTKDDPRLRKVFQATRQRFLDDKDA